MKANCPRCSTLLTVDDSKVPNRPFSLKCPKCQGLVRMPAKSAATAGAGASAQPVPPAPAPPPAPQALVPSVPAMVPPAPAVATPPAPGSFAPPRQAVAPTTNAQPVGTALVALGRGEDATAVTPTLASLGYRVEFATELDECMRLLDEGLYTLVVTDWAGQGSLYQRFTKLLPETRRPIFLTLVGDDFKTGDGTTAWVVLADLVVNRADLGVCDEILKRTLGERIQLFKPILEVQARAVAAYR